MVFDELHRKNVQTHTTVIHNLVKGAIQFDSFRSKVENNMIFLYPREMPNAFIRIDMTQQALDINTHLLWEQINDWVKEEKNACV